MVTIARLTEVSQSDLDSINVLVNQLSERLPKCSPELLKKIVMHKDVELWVVRDQERIVGMGTLAIVVIPEGERAQIEDVVVDSAYRGQGLGEKIMRTLIDAARARNVRGIGLTSRSERVAAVNMYTKMGFEKWETNVYRLKL